MYAPNDSRAVLVGGADAHIRYWNTVGAHCYHMSVIDSVRNCLQVNWNECYTVSSNSSQRTQYVQSVNSDECYRGVEMYEEVPSGNATEMDSDPSGSRLRMPSAHHKDAIVGMSVVDVPAHLLRDDCAAARLLLSSSRDGVIKVWK